MIENFRGKYGFLSNFYECEIVDKYGYVYPSSEHAYISTKKNTDQWRNYCANSGVSAGELKRQSKSLKPPNWDTNKVIIMYRILKQKFSKEPFKSLLLQTADEYIQEGNNWGDTFWGVDLKTNQGENNLGKILMRIRDEINSKQQ